MVGCSDPRAECVLNRLEDVHVGEGVCLILCSTDQECPAGLPFCNDVAELGQGVCSEARLGPGAYCGSVEPRTAGVTRRCDRVLDPNLTCVSVEGLLPDGVGFCASTCGPNRPCVNSEPGVGPYECTRSSEEMVGFCTIDCSNSPENCDGLGSGAGRMCYDQLALGDEPVGFCLDRLEPTLPPTILSADGTMIASQGGNCDDPGDDLSFARCPEATFCLPVQPNVGFCLYGCGLGAIPSGCELVSPTATCTDALMDGVRGVCGE